MRARAKEGACLDTLVRMAKPLCQAAEHQCPRTGPGRPPTFPDWAMAMLIMVAVLKKKKSKSAQYRFLSEHQIELARGLGLPGFPARSTYFERYRRGHRLFEVAIRLQGRQAVAEGLVDATTVAVDKSLIAARGPLWHPRDRKAGRLPAGLRGVDRDSTWGYSPHHGWVQGYSYEVVVTAGKRTGVFPLLASADTGSASEYRSFPPKIEQLPEQTRHVLADSGYDGNEQGEEIEYAPNGRRTGRRFICAPNRRRTKKRKGRSPGAQWWAQQAGCRRRQQRITFYQSVRGQRLYARRSQTVEPFNEWFKSLFELDQCIWHRGLDNNRTQLLAALFSYQLLVRYNHRCGRRNGQIKWILDTL
jgi:hypothetical protein